jgi:2,5-diketo-D-gluconate reductase A
MAAGLRDCPAQGKPEPAPEPWRLPDGWPGMTDITLNDGRTMPQLGMGTWQIADTQAAMIVRKGLDLGYRLVDTAAIYRNELGVGDGYKGADAFLTTKLWNDAQGKPEAALDESLALLGLDAVDLYLIHWPAPGQEQFVDAWKALVALRDAGKARSIGVSNFLPEHLDAIIDATGVTPAVNQIELHPRFQQRDARAYHDAHGIVTQSWSPIGQGKGLLEDEAIARIAAKHARSAAQVVLAWHLARGLSVIPKASSAEHLSDNFAAQDLTLDDEDIAAIDAMDDPDGRIGPHPESM